MSQININEESENKLSFLASVCPEFDEMYDAQCQGTLEADDKKIAVQNLFALGYGEETITDFVKLNPKYEESELSWLNDFLETCKEKQLRCYGCEKMGCSTEDIERCFGKCSYNADGNVNNSVYKVANISKYEEHVKVTEAYDYMDSVLDKVADGSKDAPFADKALKALATLKQFAPEKYEEVTEELDEKKISITKLEKQLPKDGTDESSGYVALSHENANEHLKKYVGFINAAGAVIGANGWLYYEDDDETMAICNFIPEIVGKYLYDDGIEPTVYFKFRLLINGEQTTEEYKIPSYELKSDKNIYKYFGDRAVIISHYDVIRAVALQAAESVPTITLNCSTGWLKSSVTDKYAYCFSGESIGDETVHVAEITDLPGYCMQDTEGISLQEAFETYKALEKLMPYKEGYMRTLCNYATGSILVTKLTDLGIPPKNALWIVGMTGGFKTSVGKLLTSFYGRTENPASNFQDSKASIEKKLYIAGDALLLVDDFCPSSTAAEERSKVDKANMVIRNIGDRVSRARAKSDMSLAKTYPPRGNVIITGEDIIGGVSTLARNIAVPITRGDIKSEDLTNLQNKKAHLNAFMKEYILYVKEHVMDQCDFDFTEMFLKYRTEAQSNKHHRRLAETVAHLRIDQYVLNAFLVDKNLITKEEADERDKSFKVELATIVEHQNELLDNDDPALLFMKALAEMIVSNEITPASAVKPDHSVSKRSPVFFEGEFYYLLPSEVYSKVVEFYRRRDKNFVLSERSLWSTLNERSVLERTVNTDGHAEYKINKRIGKRSARVIVIKKAVVESY